MADRLVIRDLAARCRLGTFSWEQAKAQPVWFDLELAINARRVSRRDDVRSAVDYARLVSTVKQLVEGKPYRLMETMAEEIAALILKRFRTAEVMVRVKKRSLPGVDYAAVEVARRAS